MGANHSTNRLITVEKAKEQDLNILTDKKNSFHCIYELAVYGVVLAKGSLKPLSRHPKLS